MKQLNVPIPAERQRRIDADANPLLVQLLSATPAQIDAWLTANVTNLAQARAVLAAFALALRDLYRRG